LLTGDVLLFQSSIAGAGITSKVDERGSLGKYTIEQQHL